MEAAEAFIAITEVTDDILDYKRLKEHVEFQRKNNPALKDKSIAEIAEDSGMCETTYKGILNGRNRNPRVATLTRMLIGVGGGSIDWLVGLDPARGFRAEEAVYGKTLVEALQARVDAKNERIEEYKKQVSDLETENQRVRRLYLAACEEVGALKEAGKHTDECRKRARRFAVWMMVAFVVILILTALLVVFLIDLSNPEFGRIGEVKWR